MKAGLYTFCIGWCILTLCKGMIIAQSLAFDGQVLQDDGLSKAHSLNIAFEDAASQKKWKLDVGVGLITGPYVSQLKDGFKSIDLQGCISTFFGQECYPQNKPDLGFTASLSRIISNRFSIGVMVHKSYILGVEGYRDGIRGAIGSRVLSIAPMLNFSLKNYILFGMGPAYHAMDVRFLNNQTTVELSLAETQTFKKPGFILEAAGIYPAEGLIFIKANLRYLYAGPSEIGPYSIHQLKEFPKSNVSFNQILLNFGVGFRW